ncbi:hypothetical protein ACWKJC_33240 [Pseudomonas aeruginosa]
MELKFRTTTGAIIGADLQVEAPTPVRLAEDGCFDDDETVLNAILANEQADD